MWPEVCPPQIYTSGDDGDDSDGGDDDVDADSDGDGDDDDGDDSNGDGDDDDGDSDGDDDDNTTDNTTNDDTNDDNLIEFSEINLGVRSVGIAVEGDGFTLFSKVVVSPLRDQVVRGCGVLIVRQCIVGHVTRFADSGRLGVRGRVTSTRPTQIVVEGQSGTPVNGDVEVLTVH